MLFWLINSLKEVSKVKLVDYVRRFEVVLDAFGCSLTELIGVVLADEYITLICIDKAARMILF